MPVKKLTDKDKTQIRENIIVSYCKEGKRYKVVLEELANKYDVTTRTIASIISARKAKTEFQSKSINRKVSFFVPKI